MMLLADQSLHKQTYDITDWQTQLFQIVDSEDDFRSGYPNVSHQQHFPSWSFHLFSYLFAWESIDVAIWETG